MNILYSFNKTGYEASMWEAEIVGSSCSEVRYVPFNHGRYCHPSKYLTAQSLENLYYAKDASLLLLYTQLLEAIKKHRIDAIIVDNCNPYHPDILKSLDIYKVLRTSDGPMAAYDRDVPYYPYFETIVYPRTEFAHGVSMVDHLIEYGVSDSIFVPLGVFSAMVSDEKTVRDKLRSGGGSVEVCFVGSLHLDKMESIAAAKRYYGKRMVLYGLSGLKRNAYLSFKLRRPIVVKRLSFEDYVPLYRRTKVGINIHLRGADTLGGYRFFELPASGVCQVTDGGVHVSDYYDIGNEIVVWDDHEDMLSKIDYLLSRPSDRNDIAMAGYRAVTTKYRANQLMRNIGLHIQNRIRNQ